MIKKTTFIFFLTIVFSTALFSDTNKTVLKARSLLWRYGKLVSDSVEKNVNRVEVLEHVKELFNNSSEELLWECNFIDEDDKTLGDDLKSFQRNLFQICKVLGIFNEQQVTDIPSEALSKIEKTLEKLETRLNDLIENKNVFKRTLDKVWGSFFTVRVAPHVVEISIGLTLAYLSYKSSQEADGGRALLIGASSAGALRLLEPTFWRISSKIQQLQESSYQEKLKTKKVATALKTATTPNRYPNKSLSDICGYEKEKLTVAKTLDMLANPLKYLKHDIALPNGILFYGPPGVGKTEFIRAIISESKCPYFEIGPNDFEESRHFESYMDGSLVKNQRTNMLTTKMEAAKKITPSIIVLDELDLTTGNREGKTFDSSALSRMLTVLDGVDQGNNPYSKPLVIAATNNIGGIDSALIRSGRFDIIINLELPPKPIRKKMIEICLRKEIAGLNHITISPETVEWLADQTENMNFADIKAIINEAKSLLVFRRKLELNQEVLEETIETINLKTKRKQQS